MDTSWMLPVGAILAFVALFASIAALVLMLRNKPAYERHKNWLLPMQIISSLLMAVLILVHMNS